MTNWKSVQPLRRRGDRMSYSPAVRRPWGMKRVVGLSVSGTPTRRHHRMSSHFLYRRRGLLLFAALGLLSFTGSAALPQTADKVWRLGVLSLINNPAMHSAAVSQLAERGFVEGRNLVVDGRVGTAEQMPVLARELIGT